MFKRYKSPYESERSTEVYEAEQSPAATVRRLTPQEDRHFKAKAANEPPPRIFEGLQNKQPLSTAYRTLDQDKRIDTPKQEPVSGDKLAWNDSSAKTIPSAILPLPHGEALEAFIGETVSFQGRLNFQRLLRIDGRFEGELQSSEGKLIVGPKGIIKSNLMLREAVIEGHVEGNITVADRIEIRGYAKVVGNIEARAISVDEGAIIQGQVSILPQSDPAHPQH